MQSAASMLPHPSRNLSCYTCATIDQGRPDQYFLYRGGVGGRRAWRSVASTWVGPAVARRFAEVNDQYRPRCCDGTSTVNAGGKRNTSDENIWRVLGHDVAVHPASGDVDGCSSECQCIRPSNLNDQRWRLPNAHARGWSPGGGCEAGGCRTRAAAAVTGGQNAASEAVMAGVPTGLGGLVGTEGYR
jgi:hypothetical protein